MNSKGGRLCHRGTPDPVVLRFCLSKGIHSTRVESIRPHDETTLFCSTGMQRYNSLPRSLL
jgi:hypothetical protein